MAGPVIDYGERILSAAEAIAQQAGRAPRSSSGVLSGVLAGAAGLSDTATESFDAFGLGSHIPSATTLFNAFAFSDDPVRSITALRRQYESRFRPIALPGQTMADVQLRPGDLLVRVARGEGWGRIAVIASPQSCRHLELANAGLRGEGYPRLLPGGYVHVVEIGPRPRSLSDRFARRLTDAAGVLLPDTLVLRPLLARWWGEQAEAAEPPATPSGRPVLRLGSVHPAVRELQRRLNRVHTDLLALALPGLERCPLRETDRFDAQTAQAVVAFQQQVFDDPAKWDGVVGPETWAQLDLLAGGSPASATGAQTATPARGRRAEATEYAEAVSRSSPDYIRWVQSSLNQIDSAGLAVDGISGPLTRAAVRSFQERRGLTVDGLLGPQPEAALIAAGALPPPGSPPNLFPSVLGSGTNQSSENEPVERAVAESSRDRRRASSFDPLPFQFQVPIGGGPPGIAIPFGGAGSPLAFTVPLGGTTPAPVPAATQVGPELPATSSPVAYEPITIAAPELPLYVPPTGESAEQEEAGYCERILSSAERMAQQTAGAPRSSSGVLNAVLTDAAGVSEAESESFDPLGLGSHTPSATTLFNAFAFPDHPLRARTALRWQYEKRFSAIALPGQTMADVTLRPGDLLVRVARGEGWGHIGVIASPQSCRHLELANAGLRGEGYPRLLPGGYVHVVEIGPRPRSLSHRFARRLTDAAGVLLPDTILVRPILPRFRGEQAEAAEPAATASARPVLRLGTVHPSVRELQRKLNRVHSDLVSLALPGLEGCPLSETDRFDAQTARAVVSFQQQVFGDPAKWDGVVGPETWAQLDLLAGGTPTPASHASRQAPPPSRVRPGRFADFAEAESRSSPDYIRWVQTSLNSIDSTGLVVDGINGPLTKAAVRSFQTRHALDIDGGVGPQTEAELIEAGAPRPPGYSLCAVAALGTVDPTTLDISPVGEKDYAAGTFTASTGSVLHIRGNVVYPATANGPSQPFNPGLGAPAPIVFMAHGNHPTAFDPTNRTIESCGDPGHVTLPNHKGYIYFQRLLARMGIISVSVDCNETNCQGLSANNIHERADLIVASIRHFQSLNSGGDPTFVGRIDFNRVGLLGHSRGAEAVLVVPELTGSRAPSGAAIVGVISLAPTDKGTWSGAPHGYTFMAILPAADGDVVPNFGAKYYDQATPHPFKTQLYIHEANHNFFNREWVNPDLHSGAGPLARPEHERLLNVYGSAFFREVFFGHGFRNLLAGREIPPAARTGKVHVSAEFDNPVATVDDFENHNVALNTLGQTVTLTGFSTANEFPFSRTPGALNDNFFGNTNGLVLRRSSPSNRLRSPLNAPMDLTAKEIWIRAAEVYEGSIPRGRTGFRIGVEDTGKRVAFVDSNAAGTIPRPFDRKADDLAHFHVDLTKTMPETFRFPARCFSGSSGFDIRNIQAIHLQLNRNDGRALAFDQLQIV